MTIASATFHAGEIEAQRHAGVEAIAASIGGFIRAEMPEQHRAFFAALPFIVVAGGDEAGRPWVTIMEGPDGFLASPDPRSLTVAASLGAEDPLAGTFTEGAAIGILGIELGTRRRNRMNGVLRPDGGAFAVEVRQSFGNCPQYIREREWRRVEPGSVPEARVSAGLDADQERRIARADTFFIGSGFTSGEGGRSDGYDASHRGGEPGFVRVAEDGTLHIPDYAGNNFFNTIGNLARDPRVGLLFVDFATGGMLQITGRARIDWAPRESHDADARRMIVVSVDKVVDRPSALALRWREDGDDHLRLRVVDKVVESRDVVSFHLADADAAALQPFEAGQHLPIELQIPGQPARVRRSYSLSGSPFAETYRITVKREERGTASRFLHDHVAVGDLIDARLPSGDFVMPRGDGPLVLVSAGVGITPMLAMLHAAVAENSARRIFFVHATRDGAAHGFRSEVDGLVAGGRTVRRKIFYSLPREEDLASAAFDAAGRLTAADLLAFEAGPDAHYMLCGPVGFLADIGAGLEAGGVPQDRIHVETFGPGAAA
ncbi:pyridoxamine 5'-phosphate oxidase family protein [Aurantimonas sp. 22II-16-19i]|uniref:FAD-binding oxidoreductase n=1 Tax=Aurantimonas sp. 22II-16-19i TaxID=1317114 RepID=UPI0009F7F9DC|nr:pyridoxamine 5'-phosphate oxidase family protein [Aurantimonas sp. 22II-16-19i]ORE95190.1 FAD/NAD-binding pyridoxamine 5'-phosphate oxidase [Aurantimonas sp. 22II-16-19i]